MQAGYRTILEALDEGRRRLARARLTTGLVRVGGAALAAVAGAILWAALQKALRLYSVPLAAVVSVGVLVFLAAAVVRWLLIPLLRLPRREEFVHLVERRYPGERNVIVNAYQLGDAEAATQGREAPELVEALVDRAARRVRQLDLRAWRDPRPDRPYLWAAGAGVAAVAVLGLVSPHLLMGASRQVLAPGLAQAPPVTLNVTPGDVEVDRGSDVPITVNVTGTGKRPSLRYRERNGSWRTRDLGPADRKGATRDGGAWQALLPDVDRDLEYALRVSGTESPLFTIEVREPLRLSGFQIHLRFPAYAGLAPETITAGTGDVSALRGTQVDLRLLANRRLARASLEWTREGKAPERLPLVADAKAPEATWYTTFRLMESATYSVVLEGEGAERWQSPAYRVEPVPDRAPFLTLHFPQEDHDLSQDLAERVVADAADDFGFSACRLVYRVDDGAERVMSYAPFKAGQTEFRLDTLWDLTALSLLPGSVVSWYLEVLDNDTVSGPKAARSPVRRVRFPTVSEIYEDVAQDHDREIDNLARLQDTQEDLHQHLEKLEEELKRGREMNYDLRQDVERSLDRQRELERQLQELVGRLDETVSKASDRAQMNQELVEKMAQINQLLENLRSDDMKRTLEQLAQALSQMDRNAMREALEAFQTTQEEMLRGMDRTIDLLKQVRREEQVEDVVRRTDEISELQQKIAEELQKLNQEMRENGTQAEPSTPEEARKGPEDPELPEDALAEPADSAGDEERQAAENAEKEGKEGKEGEPQEAKQGEPQEGKQSEGEPQEGKQEEGKPSEGEQQDGKQQEGKQGEQKDGKQTEAEKQLAKEMEELSKSLEDTRKRLAEKQDSSGGSAQSQKGQKKDDSGDQRLSRLGKDQERAQELLEELRRTLETLKKLNKEEPELAKDMEEMQASESMKNLKRNMQQSQSSMQNQMPQKASKYAFEARDQANSLAGMARNMQMQMQAKQDDEVIQMVERLIEGLIELSGGEETLVESRDPDDRVLARRQFNLGEGAEALADSLDAIGKKSLRVSEDHRKRLAGAATRMDRATRYLEEGNRAKGTHEGRESASDLNETIVALMQSHADMCQSKGGGNASEQMKQKMQGLSQAQQDLNRSTREMMQRMAGKPRLSMTDSQRLSQLAAQQEMIRQGLEQAAQDHQDLRELMGDMDSVQKEMKDVEETLRQQGTDPRVLDRQEKILSRLLEAQHSIRQQEMSPERESRTGTLVERRPPPPLPEHLLRSERTLEEDVLRGADDRYPSQYRKLVEAYFRALSREGRNP